MSELIRSFYREQLKVEVYETESRAGEAAADHVTNLLKSTLAEKGKVNLILATGTSQLSFLEALIKKDIDWGKITVFHLDEYKGMSDSHPASFRKYLKERILDIVKPAKVYLINGDAPDLDQEIKNYSGLLKQNPVDIACIGIGENGHIAFNDPPVADFNDPEWVKVVELDEACRRQQLGEGWFPTFDDVPREAVTLTVTAIMNCRSISCVVPGKRKSMAIRNTLYGEISTSCPATILRKHPETILFLDRESASEI
jgi:glucosamine-6-phosphate deaminase